MPVTPGRSDTSTDSPIRPAVLLRLATAGGRSDRIRTALTSVSSALATVTLLAAATVAAIPDGDAAYRVEMIARGEQRAAVIAALLLVAVPILVLAGQSIRFGSPARDRRFALLRLVGATPGQAVQLAVCETVLAALLGSVAGLASFLALRVVLGHPVSDGAPALSADVAGAGLDLPAGADLVLSTGVSGAGFALPTGVSGADLALPTDVLPPVVVMILILLFVPVSAAIVAAVLLRPVIMTPLGVVRRVRDRRPAGWPGLLIIGGVLAPVIVNPFGGWLLENADEAEPSPGLAALTLAAVVLLATAGVLLGSGWIAYTCGELLQRFGQRPGMLLAGRRLTADPWSGSRLHAALFAALIVGAGASGVRSYVVAMQTAGDRMADLSGRGPVPGGEYQLNPITLVDLAVTAVIGLAAAGILVALAEGITSRRRVYAAQVAAGVPRRVLSEAIAWQALAPAVPAVLISLTLGWSIVRSLGSTVTVGAVEEQGLRVTMPIAVPFADLVMLGGGAVVALAAVAGMGALLLRSNTDLEEIRVG
ncbi:FtsX-like permease family protein [Actinoplanes subglobosus]|uniref:FtsX-like permease family protein n=1 Tax=Actinoplanes subglobosus TaxID=1547892 RepID=A0ABV8IIB1_9ACTN